MSSPPPKIDDKAVADEVPQPNAASDAASPTSVDKATVDAPTLQLPSTTPFKRGHAPKPSVGIAASLFGSAGDDDPFSSIAASNGTSSLGQLTEAEEEPDLFGQSSAGNNHDNLNGSDSAADPVTSLFGSESASSGPAQPSANLASLPPATDGLTVPGTDGKASSHSSGPASPGGLFGDSSYQDDWLAQGAEQKSRAEAAHVNEEGTSAHAADPFAAANGGQGSLSWLNQEESQAANEPFAETQYDAYGRPIASADSEIVGHEQESYDQQHQYHQGYDHDQQQQAYGYEQQHPGYDYSQHQQNYDQQSGYDYQQSGYDQHQAYGQQQGYDQQQSYDQQPSYNQQGYSQQGYEQGYDQQGYDQQGYNQQGYDQRGHDQQGYDKQHYAHQDYSQSGYQQQHDTHANQYGYDPSGNENPASYAAADPYAAASSADDARETAQQGYDANAYAADPAYQANTDASAAYAGYGEGQNHAYDASAGGQAYDTAVIAGQSSRDQYSADPYSTYGSDNYAQQPSAADPYPQQQSDAYDPYAPSQQPQQQGHSGQDYSHDAGYGQSNASSLGAGAYGDLQSADVHQSHQSLARAPSPYDPPATSASPAAPLSSTAKASSLPPPPKGPPHGPPRGPSRGPSRTASRNAHAAIGSASSAALEAPPMPARSSSAVSLEEESHQDLASVPSNGVQTPQKRAQPLLGSTDTPPATYKAPPSAWVDSLEQAAATPPAFNAGDESLPTLTVTDESEHEKGYAAEGTDEVETSMREVEHQLSGDQPHDAVDEAANAFGDLNLYRGQQNEELQSSHAEIGYAAEEDGTTPQAADHAESHGPGYGDAETGQYDAEGGYDYNQPDAARENSNWNSWDEQGGEQAPATTEHNPYSLSHESVEPSEAYDAAQYANEDPYAPSTEAYGLPRTFAASAAGEDDPEARTPLAAHDEQGSWLGVNSSTIGNGTVQDPYSPSAVANSTFGNSQHQQPIYGGYDPPTVSDRSVDPYNAANSHAQAQRGVEASTSDTYGQTQYIDDQSTEANYFDGNKRAVSPQQYGNINAYGAPPSPYAPHDQYASSTAGPGQGAPSAASDARSQSASEASADMLQTRRGATIPIASFGIGGKLVSYFPTSRGSSDAQAANGAGGSGNAYGSYSYNASSYPTQVNVQALSSLVPSSAYASAFDPLTFPGPVFEGAAGTNVLSRATGAAASGKSKKAAVIKHLDERIQDLSAGVGYLRRRPSFSTSSTGSNRGAPAEQDGELEARRTEDKVLLLRLLRLLVENDGQTSSAAFEQGVRSLIVAPETRDTASSGAFAMSVTSTTPDGGAEGSVVTSHELRTGFLQKVQGMLLRGERREAVEFAVAQKMWAHAMTIASCVDKDCWKQVVSEFIENEVGAAETSLVSQGQGDLQGLKVAYNVFSGQDPASIFDLFRTKTQLGQLGALQPTLAGSNTTSAALPSWKESAAIVASNRSASDSAALTAIGDGLCTRGLIEAAHFCYLLSPQTSPIGGADTNGARFTLLGLSSPKTSAAFAQDLDSILMTEVLEFAQGMVPTVKGLEPFPGIAHLQAYKLVHAQQLADLGEVGKAQRYCEAIAQCLKQSKASPYLHSTLLSQSKQLSDRLVGAPQAGPGGNWVTRKMQRPTLDGVWGALEGRFTKFIAGEEGAADADSPNKNSKGSVSSSLGPFSHYSAITPDAASGGMTRQPSFNELRAGSPSVPTSRSGSAMDFRNATKRAASPKHRASTALSMRPLNSDPYSDWPQPRPAGNGNGSEAASNHERDSARSSSEAARSSHGYGASLHAGSAYGAGHSAQASAFSTASSTYGGAGETSFAADTPPWHGSVGQGTYDANSSRRPSTDAGGAAAGSESAYGGYGDYGGYGSSSYGGYGGTYGDDSQIAETGGEDAGDTNDYAAPSHGATPFYGYDPHGAQKPQFVSNVGGGDALEGGDEGGFVSPFDALSSNSRTPQPQSQSNQYAPSYGGNQGGQEEEEDDDDLGLGNSSSRRATSKAVDEPSSEAGDASRRDSVASSSAAANTSRQSDGDGKKDDSASKAGGGGGDDKRQELKPSASWFGRIWGRSPSTDSAAQQAQAKAKKAHLGEETSFVYDKELKRWVNKKVGDSGGAASTPPPPPPRAQSASPASQPDRSAGASSAPPMRGPPSGSYTMGRATPPISEGNDEGSSGLAPSRGPPGMGSLNRARSNLADHSMPPASQPPMGGAGPPGRGSGSSTPAGSSSTGPPPPPGGSKTGTVKKRPIKSRYVVVD